MAMAWTNITLFDDHFEHHPPITMQPNIRPSIEEASSFNLGLGSTLPGNSSPYKANAAAMVAGRRVGQWSMMSYQKQIQK